MRTMSFNKNGFTIKDSFLTKKEVEKAEKRIKGEIAMKKRTISITTDAVTSTEARIIHAKNDVIKSIKNLIDSAKDKFTLEQIINSVMVNTYLIGEIESLKAEGCTVDE